MTSPSAAQDLEPIDEDRIIRCRTILSEIEVLPIAELSTIEQCAPQAWAQLQQDSSEAAESVEVHVGHFQDGVDGWIVDLVVRCRNELERAEQRRKIIETATLQRTRRLVLSTEDLELLARYQSTLDAQLYKALKALREAQQWRLATLEVKAD